jgi:hypothetical protein
MSAAENSPTGNGAPQAETPWSWEGEKGTSVFSITGKYAFVGIDLPFSGFMHVQDETGKLFGRIIDPDGSATVIGVMKGDDLSFVKVYDAFPISREVHPEPSLARRTHRSDEPEPPRPEPVTINLRGAPNLQSITYRLKRGEDGLWSGRYGYKGLQCTRRDVSCAVNKIDTPAINDTFERAYSDYDPSTYEQVLRGIQTEIKDRREQAEALRMLFAIIKSGEFDAMMQQMIKESGHDDPPDEITVTPIS